MWNQTLGVSRYLKLLCFISGWHSLQPVLPVPRCCPAEAEERAGRLSHEPHRVRPAVPGFLTALAAVHLSGNGRWSSPEVEKVRLLTVLLWIYCLLVASSFRGMIGSTGSGCVSFVVSCSMKTSTSASAFCAASVWTATWL